jgi:hypothetical protein
MGPAAFFAWKFERRISITMSKARITNNVFVLVVNAVRVWFFKQHHISFGQCLGGKDPPSGLFGLATAEMTGQFTRETI